MPDEPTLGELSRRLDNNAAMLTQLVQRAEYAADQRLTERRFIELERDVDEVRRTLGDDIKAVRSALDAAAEKRTSNVKQAFYAGILPAVLVLAGIVVQIWLAARGG
ncbi:hypothetical protein ACQP2T_28045 [Nonomuraea sp. CA-143628]|uniref:hypothetical protein n=1 Tax=Nonomuraea sp. CA-143628 TaxID=3239997 RepID=UPI003D8AAAE0